MQPTTPFQHQYQKKFQQVNLHGKNIESTDVKHFGNIFTTNYTRNTTRVVFQNFGPQPKSKHSYKAKRLSTAMSNGNYNVFLFAEHGINQKNIEADHSWHHRVCMNSCGTFSQLNYNIHNNKNDASSGPWRQYGGTGFAINENFRARKVDHGGNSCNLGRWSWVNIEGKDNKCTVFISSYRPCKNTAGINTV